MSTARDTEMRIDIERWVFLLLVLLAVLIASIWVIRRGSLPAALMLVALPFVLLLIGRLDLWLAGAVSFFPSSIRAFGLPGNLQAHHVIIAGAALLWLSSRIVARPRKRLLSYHYWIFMLAACVMIVICVRGTGFRILGSSHWGGTRYVHMLTGMALPIISWGVTMRRSLLRRSILMMGLLALVPFFCSALYVVSGGRITQQFYFSTATGGGMIAAAEAIETGGLARLQMGSNVALFVLLMPFALFRFQGRQKLLYAALIALAVVAVGVSGYRTSLLRMGAFIAGAFLFLEPRHRFRKILLMGICALTLYGIILLSAPYLPRTFQRAISVLPFVKIDPEVEYSAMATTRWRLELWKTALHEIPKYILVGKGYTIDIDTAYWLQFSTHRAVEFGLYSVAYHNGFLSLIIGLGLPGLLSAVAFIVTAMKVHLSWSMGEWRSEDLKRTHRTFLIWFIVETVFFFTVYGDAFTNFVFLFVAVAVMQLARAADQHLPGCRIENARLSV